MDRLANSNEMFQGVLCALGIKPDYVGRILIAMDPSDLVHVTVERYMLPLEGGVVQSVLEQYEFCAVRKQQGTICPQTNPTEVSTTWQDAFDNPFPTKRRD